MSTATARRLPVRTALSGPAAGVIAAAAIARAAGFPNVDHRRSRRHLLRRVARGRRRDRARGADHHRFRPRHPHPDDRDHHHRRRRRLDRPVDAGGLLQVGPESAGSRPGPVCYGQGNTRPTLTDANVVLGRINAERPIGGKLWRASTSRRPRRAIAVPCGGARSALTPMTAAEAIVRVANAKMAGAIRLVSIERGHDPGTLRGRAVRRRRSSACRSADQGCRSEGRARAALSRRDLGARLRHRRHPPRPGADREPDARRPRRCGRSTAGWSSEADAARAVVEAAGLADRADRHRVRARHALCRTDPHRRRCRCRRQLRDGTDRASHPRWCDPPSSAPIRPRSAACLPGVPAKIVNLRTAAIGRRPAFRSRGPRAGRRRLRSRRRGAARARSGSRAAWHDSRDLRPARRCRSERRSRGPAVLEQPDATTLIDPDLVARVDRLRQPHRGASRMSAQAAIGEHRAAPLVDLQNDFLHPDGAYGRAGQTRRRSPRCRRG